MKTSKECTTCRHHYLPAQDYPCSACGHANKLWESASGSITITTHIHSKPERDKPNKMKDTTPNRIIEALKEMFTITDQQGLILARMFGAILIIASLITNFQIEDIIDAIIINLSLIVVWIFGYFSRKPDPARKGFKKWLKICKLNVQIAILKKNLKPYQTLNKIKHQRYKLTREIVKEWRLELNELKRELKNI